MVGAWAHEGRTGSAAGRVSTSIRAGNREDSVSHKRLGLSVGAAHCAGPGDLLQSSSRPRMHGREEAMRSASYNDIAEWYDQWLRDRPIYQDVLLPNLLAL